MTPEKKIQNSIIKYFKDLQKQGYPVFIERRQAGGFSYKKGEADLYVVINGLHIEIEVKAENGEQSVMQEKWESFCKSVNIPYLLIKDLEELQNIVKREGWL